MKTTTNYSSFKQAVLKSGIPLEKTVAQALHSLDIWELGEYFYERDGKLFSIDSKSVAHFSLDLDIERESDNIVDCYFSMNFLIECKYKEPNHRWVFASYQHPKDEVPEHTYFDTFFLDDLLHDKLRKVGCVLKDKAAIDKAGSEISYGINLDLGLSLVNTGVEILKNGFNPSVIKEALFQVAYGMGNVIVDEVISYGQEESYLIKLGNIIYPIIVTTADLYVIKADQTVDTIRASKNQDESFEKVGAVFYCLKPHLELQEHTRSKFLQHKSDILSSSYFSEAAFNVYVERRSWFHPAILIVNLTSFEKVVGEVSKKYRASLDQVSGCILELKE